MNEHKTTPPQSNEGYENMTPIERTYFQSLEDFPRTGVVLHFEDKDLSDSDSPVMLLVRGTGENLINAVTLIILDLSKQMSVPVPVFMGKLISTVRQAEMTTSLSELFTSDTSSLLGELADLLDGKDDNSKRTGHSPSIEDMLKDLFG